MATLNMHAASLMKKHGAHGATDITGFGVRGHAGNLCAVQKEPVDFVFKRYPIIRGMHIINNEAFDFGLMKGTSAETSGGLLIMLPEAAAQDFKDDLWQQFGQRSWIVGDVVPSDSMGK